ncbi:hypothetical protein KI387_012159, partial [Taxus chinensis]
VAEERGDEEEEEIVEMEVELGVAQGGCGDGDRGDPVEVARLCLEMDQMMVERDT